MRGFDAFIAFMAGDSPNELKCFVHAQTTVTPNSQLQGPSQLKVLVINSGSSSIKFELFEMSGPNVIVGGALERIGDPNSRLRVTAGPALQDREMHVPNHRDGMRLIATELKNRGDLETKALFGVGHRVVHGGESFQQPTPINEQVLEAIRAQIPLAPLHNPGNIAGIEVALETFPQVPQVAVFDTAFHQSIPQRAFRYALPNEYYEQQGVRRYGFHGTSHQYISKRAAEWLGREPSEVNLITLHLGNGASIAAIRKGQSIDTSMGMTPLEGLMMGTRSGDIDPAVLLFLQRSHGLTADDLDDLLNRRSGLKGVCGANDMREVLALVAAGDAAAKLALDMYTYRIRKYIGAYFAALGSVDALVFSAGIGENVPEIREQVCAGLDNLGILLDRESNLASGSGIQNLHRADSQVQILVVPTNEELEIAHQTKTCVESSRSRQGSP